MDIPPRVREVLERRGLDPASVPDAPDAPEPVSGWLSERVAEVLAESLPPRFADAETDHPDVSAWVQSALRDPRRTPALLLTGPTGTGKSYAAFAAYRAVLLGAARGLAGVRESQGEHVPHVKGCPVAELAPPENCYTTCSCPPAVQAQRKQAGRPRSLRAHATTHPRLVADARPTQDGSHRAAVERCERASLLLLDDLGTIPTTDWSVGEVLFRVIDYRWSHQLPSIFTTNLSRRNLQEALGDRVTSRLTDAVVVTLTGPDRRRSRA